MYDIKQIIDIINNKLKIKTFSIDTTYYNSYIGLMNAWYKGYVPQEHTFTNYNGIKKVTASKCKINMAKHICEDHASLTFNENIVINIDGTEESQFILGHEEMTGVLGKNNFWALGASLYEITCALGTSAVEVILSNMLKVNDKIMVDSNLTEIKLIQHNAFDIIPLSWDSNLEIKEIAFVSSNTIDGKEIINLRLHVLEDNKYVIYNKNIQVVNNVYNLLSTREDDVIEQFNTGSDIPWFSVLKLPLVNNYDINSVWGASVYANSTDILKIIDEGVNMLYNEFANGNKKVFYSKELLEKDKEGNLIAPDNCNKTLFYYTGESLVGHSNDGNKLLIHEFNPELRIDAIIDGIKSAINMLTTMCGLGSNFYKFNNGSVEKTATEVVSENSSMYRNIRKNEMAVEKFILNIIKTCLYIGKEMFKINLNIDTNVSVSFDTSIIEDKTAIRERELKEVELGIMTVEEYRDKWYGSSRRDTVNLSKNIEDTLE